jgi:DNA polymerase III subunit delta'
MGFDSFLGNSAAVQNLREMLRAERVPGALLFTGPEGVGKKTLALMMAKAMVCERLADDFCGECPHCKRAEEMLVGAAEDLSRRREIKESARRVEGLVYFDLQVIAPFTRYILTEQIRLLRQIAYTRPFEFPRRILIIDQAQAIHWQAVDLLLKVLEEPPATTTFILVCPNASELRLTIRSRCQRIAFSPVDEDSIVKLLAAQSRLPEAKRALVARLSGGSVGKALGFDLAAYLERREPWLQFLESLARGLGPDAASPAAGNRATPDWHRVFEATRALTGDREHFDEILGIGYGLLGDLLHALECGERARVAHLDIVARLRPWAAKLGFRGIEMLKSGLDQAYRLQVRNVNQQLGLDALAVGIASRGRTSSLKPKGAWPSASVSGQQPPL